MNKYIIAILMLFSMNVNAGPTNCKQWVGDWNVTWTILGDWTDTIHITQATANSITVYDDFGNKISAACKKGVVIANDGSSDYVSTTYYLSNGFARVVSTYFNDWDLSEPWLLVDFDPATVTPAKSTKSAQSVKPNDDGLVKFQEIKQRHITNKQ